MADPAVTRPGSITTRPGPGGFAIGHINSPKYAPKVPNMNINHGWKIHGDLVADLTREEAFAKMGLEANDTGAKVIDQKAYDAFNSRLSKIGIDRINTPSQAKHFGDSFLISRKTEEIVAPVATQVVNGRPVLNVPQYKRSFSNPLDTLSMMEVFHENETQYKASPIYREGRSFTGYTQSIENRDKLISSLESRLGDRLQDINPTILGGHQTEGATQLSQKITGRFTTEYTDIPGAGGTMDWASQNPAGSKGQAAIDNVMTTNPEMRPYIHTGVIGDESAANLQKLSSDFPVFNEMLHGPKGYVSPYGTIEDSFSQQGYDYKTGAAVKSAPVNPQTPLVTPASVATTNATKVTPLADEYDTGKVAAKISAGEPLTVTPPVSTPPKGLKVGTPTNDIRVTPRNRGADPASGGKSKPKAQSSPINTSTQNPKPDPSAKITSNPPPSGEPTLKIGSPEPSKATTKPKGLMDNGMKTAQDLASGNARAMGIAAAAGLLGVGIAMSNRKRTIAPDDGTYLSQSRAKLERLKGIAPSHRGSEAHVLYC